MPDKTTEIPEAINTFLAGLAKQVDERLDRRDAIRGKSLHENRQRSFQDGYAQGLSGAARSLRAAAPMIGDLLTAPLREELEEAKAAKANVWKYAERVERRARAAEYVMREGLGFGPERDFKEAFTEIEARADSAERRLAEARGALELARRSAKRRIDCLNDRGLGDPAYHLTKIRSYLNDAYAATRRLEEAHPESAEARSKRDSAERHLAEARYDIGCLIEAVRPLVFAADSGESVTKANARYAREVFDRVRATLQDSQADGEGEE